MWLDDPRSSIDGSSPNSCTAAGSADGTRRLVEFVLTSTQRHHILLPKEENSVTFGERLRQLRKGKGLTLRGLADAVGVDFTYLSKIENGKVGYLPGADTIRTLAQTLEADPLELLTLADKMPPELQGVGGDARARRFFNRAQEIASPDDWDALLSLLEKRQQVRKEGGPTQ
jgi:transcriptional regulator with XRE-family HTH domain